MKSVCSTIELETYFGTLYTEILNVLTKTYSLIAIRDNQVYFTFQLDKIFKESFEMFSIDPSLVSDMFVVNELFRDESVDPELLVFIMDWLQSIVEYEPSTDLGELCFSFDDIEMWYGETFDNDMRQLYPEYDALKEYIKLN